MRRLSWPELLKDSYGKKRLYLFRDAWGNDIFLVAGKVPKELLKLKTIQIEDRTNQEGNIFEILLGGTPTEGLLRKQGYQDIQLDELEVIDIVKGRVYVFDDEFGIQEKYIEVIKRFYPRITRVLWSSNRPILFF